jgi:hypothetical protein
VFQSGFRTSKNWAADHERPGPFQVDDNEGGPRCGLVDLIEDHVLADVIDDDEGGWLAGARKDACRPLHRMHPR